MSPKPVLSVSLTGLTVSPLWQTVSLANISLTVRATGRALVAQVTPGALLTSQGRMGWSLYPSSFLPSHAPTARASLVQDVSSIENSLRGENAAR